MKQVCHFANIFAQLGKNYCLVKKKYFPNWRKNDGLYRPLLLLLFGQILPIAHGHVLPVLTRIEALLDADGLEVSLPQLLKEAFVLVQQTVVQAAGGKVWQVVRLVEGDAAKVRQVVVETIGATHVVDQPALVGKAVAEVGHNQRQGVLLRLDGGKVGAVGRLLEANKLHQPVGLLADSPPHAGEGQHVGVGKVGLDGARGVDSLADVAEEKHGRLRLLGQPALRQAVHGRCRQLLLQTAPHTVGLGIVGMYGKHLVAEQRQGLVRALQCVGEGAAGVGLENGCQKAGKGVVELEDGHGNEE